MPDASVSVRRRYFPAIEGMRGVAALTVLVGHLLLFSYSGGAGYALGRWLAPFGLVIFFLISGFLLYRPFIAARSDGERVAALTGPYLWRRAVRILPGYWVALTLSTIWLSYEGVFGSHAWVYYGLLQVYSEGWIHGGLPVAWSLGAEISFYLALPIVALVLAKRGIGSGHRDGAAWEMGSLGGLFLLSVAWRILAGTDGADHVLAFDLIGCIGWFALGMAMAAMQVAHPAAFRRPRALLGRPGLCWPLALLIFVLVLATMRSGTSYSATVQFLVEGLALGLAALLLLGPAVFGDGRSPVRQLLANPVAVWIGTISFGIYLWHWAFLAWLSPKGVVLDAPEPFLVLGALTLAGSIVLGAASWYGVERPLMRRARSAKALLGGRREPASVAAG